MTNTYCAPSLGIDIVKISELLRIISDISSMAITVFTESELRDNAASFSLTSQYQHLAGIFAAKEAFMKAYGKKVGWKDVWVEKNEEGKPVLYSSLLSP
ncbi:MAG: 4'-phosphopantetheinyl transferase superfamily protein, partial [Candidatus Colwellbacteria bacterium]|nr:4'-phosphopantetheinyl transferase superfamily protein [Candidatus Colwellbacteria bacterium]